MKGEKINEKKKIIKPNKKIKLKIQGKKIKMLNV